MNTIEAIIKRRSIRKYSDKPISDEDIKDLLKAGMYAPSAYNEQPWEFVVIKNKETMNKVMEFHPHSKMLETADCAILVCGNLEKENPNVKGFWIQDCSAAVQNILVSAESKGIGSVWIGVYPNESLVSKTSEAFSLPENIVPFAFISLGYPVKEKEIPERFNEDCIHYETWNQKQNID